MMILSITVSPQLSDTHAVFPVSTTEWSLDEVKRSLSLLPVGVVSGMPHWVYLQHSNS